jgi:hypothetical protein
MEEIIRRVARKYAKNKSTTGMNMAAKNLIHHGNWRIGYIVWKTAFR